MLHIYTRPQVKTAYIIEKTGSKMSYMYIHNVDQIIYHKCTLYIFIYFHNSNIVLSIRLNVVLVASLIMKMKGTPLKIGDIRTDE